MTLYYCHVQVHNVSGALHKLYKSIEEAETTYNSYMRKTDLGSIHAEEKSSILATRVDIRSSVWHPVLYFFVSFQFHSKRSCRCMLEVMY